MLEPLPRWAIDGARGKGVAEAEDDGLAGEAVEAVALDALLEISGGQGQVGGDLGHGAMEGVVEAGEVGARGRSAAPAR